MDGELILTLLYENLQFRDWLSIKNVSKYRRNHFIKFVVPQFLKKVSTKLAESGIGENIISKATVTGSFILGLIVGEDYGGDLDLVFQGGDQEFESIKSMAKKEFKIDMFGFSLIHFSGTIPKFYSFQTFSLDREVDFIVTKDSNVSFIDSFDFSFCKVGLIEGNRLVILDTESVITKTCKIDDKIIIDNSINFKSYSHDPESRCQTELGRRMITRSKKYHGRGFSIIYETREGDIWFDDDRSNDVSFHINKVIKESDREEVTVQ